MRMDRYNKRKKYKDIKVIKDTKNKISICWDIIYDYIDNIFLAINNVYNTIVDYMALCVTKFDDYIDEEYSEKVEKFIRRWIYE